MPTLELTAFPRSGSDPVSVGTPSPAKSGIRPLPLELDQGTPTDPVETRRRTAGRYRKGRQLGAGAFGTVFKGYDRLSGAFVAMKEVRCNDLEQTDEVRKELELLQMLSHPNIVRYIDFELVPARAQHPPRLRIYLEYVEGGSLASVLSQFGALSEAVIRVYTRQALEGLEYLHQKQVMHLDIKPANLLVSTYGEVKLTDFGASKRVVQSSSTTLGRRTRGEGDMVAAGIVGSPAYVAPETVKGVLGFEADVWSLGCTVVELASGAQPWKGTLECTDVFSFLHKVATTDVVPSIPASLSAACQAFIGQMLVRDPPGRMNCEALLVHEFMTCCGDDPCEKDDATTDDEGETSPIGVPTDSGHWDPSMIKTQNLDDDSDEDAEGAADGSSEEVAARTDQTASTGPKSAGGSPARDHTAPVDSSVCSSSPSWFPARSGSAPPSSPGGAANAATRGQGSPRSSVRFVSAASAAVLEASSRWHPVQSGAQLVHRVVQKFPPLRRTVNDFTPGTCVDHLTRGRGTVVRVGSRVHVRFGSGEEHRYGAASLRKIRPVALFERQSSSPCSSIILDDGEPDPDMLTGLFVAVHNCSESNAEEIVSDKIEESLYRSQSPSPTSNVGSPRVPPVTSPRISAALAAAAALSPAPTDELHSRQQLRCQGTADGLLTVGIQFVPADFCPGDEVIHLKRGTGTVTQVDHQRRVHVRFPPSGGSPGEPEVHRYAAHSLRTGKLRHLSPSTAEQLITTDQTFKFDLYFGATAPLQALYESIGRQLIACLLRGGDARAALTFLGMPGSGLSVCSVGTYDGKSCLPGLVPSIVRAVWARCRHTHALHVGKLTCSRKWPGLLFDALSDTAVKPVHWRRLRHSVMHPTSGWEEAKTKLGFSQLCFSSVQQPVVAVLEFRRLDEAPTAPAGATLFVSLLDSPDWEFWLDEVAETVANRYSADSSDRSQPPRQVHPLVGTPENAVAGAEGSLSYVMYDFVADRESQDTLVRTLGTLSGSSRRGTTSPPQH